MARPSLSGRELPRVPYGDPAAGARMLADMIPCAVEQAEAVGAPRGRRPSPHGAGRRGTAGCGSNAGSCTRTGDSAVLTGEQIRAARELLGWSRGELSFRARLPLAVAEVVEEHGSTFMLFPGQMEAIVLAFEDASVEFSADSARLRNDP